jgi:3-oxoacyl-(acyl-carrier-protein) synthase
VARVDRFAIASDAMTITASDPSGEVLRRVLRRVVDGRPVDLVHAHGTGTQANDPVEAAAIATECAEVDMAPAIYSHKAALGHSLGASGLVSVVLNCTMHQRGLVLGNVRTVHPISALVAAHPRAVRIRRSICLAAGFGGPVACVSLVSC